MKIPILLALVLALVGCRRVSDSPLERAESPSLPSVTNQPVVGELGIPLGTVAEIHASMVSGSETRMKANEGSYLLRVMKVNGRPLTPPPLMRFHVPGFIAVKLAKDDSELYELKYGAKTGSLSSAKIEELQKDYVGKQVRLAVYETGGYSGIPKNLPDDVPAWQDSSFGFSTWIVVVAERQK